MLKERDNWRLAYHLMPPDGWLNDPNGLCQKDGRYHIYFQYAPNTPAPDGRMARTWGHYAGSSLTDLTFKGVPFWPEDLDRDGCYSGSALVEGGMINLFYTGNIKIPGEYDYIHDGRESNTILIRSSDGKRYGKKQFLFGTKDYPKECTRHVRDPKVWKEGDAHYMVLGARMQDEKGAILLYTAENLTDWKLVKIISTEKPFGYMWECPDYFALGDRKILSMCPQGVNSEYFRYQNLYQAGYYLVEGDLLGDYELKAFQEWDYGFDFYAPQTFEDEQGRRILIGWAGMPDKPYKNPTAERGWENCLTVPRCVTLEEGSVCQNPVKELKDLRGEELTPDEKGNVTLPDGTADVEIRFGNSQKNWSIRIGDGVTLKFAEGVAILDMTDEVGCGREERRIRVEYVTDMRILIDRSMLEFYLNGGRVASSSRFYPQGEDRSIKVSFHFADADASLKIWEMKPMSVNAEY